MKSKQLVAVLLTFFSFAALGQGYPSKPIRWIAPFPPGGPVDLLARTVGQKLSEAWSQPVIVENRAGAAGNLGIEQAAKAPADSYTLVIVPTGNFVVNPTPYPNLPYKASDLAPVTLLATVENVLVVHPALPASSMSELVSHAKANPGKLTFASPGAGAQAHLAGELIKLTAGIDMVHVPYKGARALGQVARARHGESQALGAAARAADDRRAGLCGIRGCIVVRLDGAGGHACRRHRQIAPGVGADPQIARSERPARRLAPIRSAARPGSSQRAFAANRRAGPT